MNDGRRPVRRRIGAANWALAGVVALCMLLGIGHLEDWASPSPAATKIAVEHASGDDGASTASSTAERDAQARLMQSHTLSIICIIAACEAHTHQGCWVPHLVKQCRNCSGRSLPCRTHQTLLEACATRPNTAPCSKG